MPGQPGTAEHIEVTLTLDTSAYVSGDVLSDTAPVPNAIRAGGAKARLVSVSVYDADDVGAALDIVFFSANVSLGTKNAVPSINDTDALKILGHVSIVTGDYIDYGGVRVATKHSMDLVLKADSGTTIYVGTITRGTPTHTANGLRLRLGLVGA